MLEFREYLRSKIMEYPDLELALMDILEMTIDNIHEGGSEDHEVELAYQSITDLISEACGMY